MIDSVVSYLKKFFEVNDPSQFIEFRVFGKKGIIKNFFIKIEDLIEESIIAKKEIKKYLHNYNFYFGVLPRIERKGTRDAIKEGSSLWIDFDCHGENVSKEDVRKKYDEFMKKLDEIAFPKPNFVLFSGKGFQCYWFLDGVVKSEKLEKMEEALLEKLSTFFPQNIDKQVKDLARIMRVPLSENVKYEQPIQTEVWFYKGIRFPVKVIEDFILKEEVREERKEELIVSPPKKIELSRKLKKHVRDKIVDWFYNFWLPGFRNSLEVSLIGTLIKNGISFEHARDIIERICVKSKDEEIKQRLKNLEYHYKKRIDLRDELLGAKGISDVIWEMLNSNLPKEILADRPELLKLWEMKNRGGLIKDDIDDYVSSVLRMFHLRRNIFKEEGLKILSLDDLLSMETEDVDYIVENLIPRNSLIIIGGKPESFKSIFTLLLATSCARGENFLKFKTRKVSVFYVDAENGEKIISQRLKYFFGSEKIGGIFSYCYSQKIEDIRKEVVKQKYDLVVFDSLRRFLKGSESESEVINKFYTMFLKPLRDQGTTVVIIHHFRKRKGDITDEELMELFRGSSDIVAMVDLAFALEKVEEVSDPENGITRYVINFKKVKNRLGIPINDFSFVVVKDDKMKRSKIEFVEYKVYLTLEDRLKEAVLDILSDGAERRRAEIEALLNARGFENINKNTLTEVLNSLVILGRIVRIKKGVYKINERDVLKKFIGDGGERNRVDENQTNS